MRRRSDWGIAIVLLAGTTLFDCAGSTAFAGWPKFWGLNDLPGFRQKEDKGKLYPPFPRASGKEATWKDQYHYQHYWPYPLNCDDREKVRMGMNMQVANGWVAETTLHDHHFDPETNELNRSGQMHLRWISLYAPPQYRAAFVSTGPNAAISQIRLEKVKAAAADVSQDNPPPVILRTAEEVGTSAQEIDMLRRKRLESMPIPRIQYRTFSSGGE